MEDKYGKFTARQSKDGRYYFILTARNGMVLATSQPYASRAACFNAIESVRSNAAYAPIEDLTESK